MPGIFNSWYSNQYASWNRMRRIQAPPFVARVDSRTSRNATAMHNGTDVNAGDVVINMGDLGSPNASSKDIKDTLFGPSIGVVGTAPEWCASDATLDEKAFSNEKEMSEKDDEKREEEDELTPEIVKEWVRRSKESSEPTTTLQALVNLKRPSLRLSPLAAPSPEPASSSNLEEADPNARHHQQHGLEFEFDCDAPQCAISLHVVGVPAHLGESDEHLQSDKSTGDTDSKDNERLVLFETTLTGGFSRKLTLAEGAVLELAMLEAAASAYRAQLAAAAASPGAPSANAGSSAVNVPATVDGAQAHEHHKKRLAFFRKKSSANSQHSTSATQPEPAPAIPTGPALAVVDAEASPHPHHQSSLPAPSQNVLTTFFASGDAERARRKKEADEEGVRVAIRLAARDAEGRPLRVRNEQVTYLHVVRQVAPAASHAANVDAPSVSGDAVANGEQQNQGQDGRDEDGREKEDTRPWVVRVVKREARIGAHSFQLHEIYGLTAHASASEAAHAVTPSSPAPVPVPSESHTYPPAPPKPQLLNGSAAADTEDSPAECLLCLSAAREVVLLPCRHLVACRECAVNMVEFGAGGTVAQPEAEVPAPAVSASGGETTGEGAAGAQGESATPAPVAPPAPVPTPTPATRRKRKAKGWFCPVCRQPYTSLLRITTAAPPSKGSGIGHSTGDASGDAKRVSLASSLEPESEPSPVGEQSLEAARPLANAAILAPASAPDSGAAMPATSEEGGTETRGTFASLARPGFLRHISGRAAGATRGRDLERGA